MALVVAGADGFRTKILQGEEISSTGENDGDGSVLTIKKHTNISREHFSFTNSNGNFARKQTPTDMSQHLDGKLIKLLDICH